jgi:ABC-type bacteriocin/lantibiotic exporter with double-glycine peptidase domain
LDNAGILKKLPKDTILSLIPGLTQIVYDISEIRFYKSGQTVVSKGEVLDYLFIPITDDLQIVFSAEKTGVLARGRSLGLQSFLENQPIDYSVISQVPNKVLCIKRKDFFTFIESKPNHLQYLKIITSSPSARSLKNYLSERNFDKDLLISLIAEMQIENPSGFESDGQKKLYFIDRGIVRVQSDPAKTDMIIDSQLSVGSWFGGVSIIPPGIFPYLVTFSNDAIVQTLDIRVVREIVRDPNLIDELSNESWLKIEQVDTSFDSSDYEGLAHIPLKPMSFSQLAIEYGIVIREESFLFATNDYDSIAKTVANLAIYFGKEPNLGSLQTMTVSFCDDISLSRIGLLCDAIGCISKGSIVSLNDLEFINYPFVFFIGNRMLTAIKKDGNQLLCLDAVLGPGTLKTKDIFNDGKLDILSIEDYSYLLKNEESSDSTLQPKKKNETVEEANIRQTKHLLVSIIKLDTRTVIKILFISLIVFMISAMVPFYSQILLDEVLKTSDHDTLLMCIFGMMLCSGFVIIFTNLKSRYILEFSLRFDQRFTRFLYKETLDLSNPELQRLGFGGIMARLNETSKVRDFFSTESINNLTNFFSIIFFTGMLLSYNIQIALIPVGAMVVIYFYQKYAKEIVKDLNRKLFLINSLTQSFISEVVSNIMAVKAFGAEQTISETWDTIIIENIKKEKQVVLETTKMNAVVGFLGQCILLGGIWMAAYLLLGKQSSFTPGEFLAISMYLQRIVSPINDLIAFISNYEEVNVSLSKLSDLIFGDKDRSSKEISQKHAITLKGKVKLDRVGFRYADDGPWILKDISLVIFPKQVVAIVGKSGSGKTTLANIIANVVEPTTGKVYYDEFDKTFLDSRSLNSQIGFIQQSSELFSGSIKSNIAYKDDIPNVTRIDECARYSSSYDFIHKLPQAYDTFLAEGGMGLSGGQKQRLSIARTLYNNPKILLLDEATSALDADSEKAFIDNLREMLKGKTAVLIAHRLSTIRNADIILVMDEGQIVQQGKHDLLIKEVGVYRELFQEQSGG